MSSSAADLGIWATIAEEAERESVLWSAALRPTGERDETPVFSSLAGGTYALGLESIYEGYLLHYGRPRLFAPADSDTAILLGDYLYAHDRQGRAGAGWGHLDVGGNRRRHQARGVLLRRQP